MLSERNRRARAACSHFYDFLEKAKLIGPANKLAGAGCLQRESKRVFLGGDTTILCPVLLVVT